MANPKSLNLNLEVSGPGPGVLQYHEITEISVLLLIESAEQAFHLLLTPLTGHSLNCNTNYLHRAVL